ncbi:Metallo-dependent hydrolase [Daedalea quercina L-15889]|uniref:Metallo-dependent hydrolase n=1 Tax=Daedalea quercina L-15889 TaxID=1314783 RepID=A0A165MCQ9_9APHY|nr:Metallo-dependent hydrolase [Daedalea quercina L-15889]
MGKNKKSSVPDEQHLHLPRLSSLPPDVSVPIVDTHTHLHSTFSTYRSKYPSGQYATIFDFVRGVYTGRDVDAIIDVWCEAPVLKAQWRELADSALSEEDRRRDWAGTEYWFVMGNHLNSIEAMSHPRCVGWGEIGLDYHYDNSLRELQQEVFTRQLRHAVRLGKPITIHTREAEEDTERILKTEVPKDHKIHIHCYTDSPALAARMLEHFPNLYIGITGVITYSSNLNTANVIRHLTSSPSSPLRILLETDAPFMVPSNVYNTALKGLKGRLPLSHTGMIPWTAEFVANVANEARVGKEGDGTALWDAEKVMRVARENARTVYDI